MSKHYLPLDESLLNGTMSREFAPVLTIDPGDTVIYSDLPDAGWGLHDSGGVDAKRRLIPRKDPEKDSGHALVGPVEVRGAKAGMTLVVHIGEIVPSFLGWNVGGGRDNELNNKLGVTTVKEESRWLPWELDPARNIARNDMGLSVTMAPFLGFIGMPPAATGRFATPPPYHSGGNIDCKEILPGTTLYLPISVDGGWIFVGDGHAAQGDGEVSITAIECPVASASLTFDLLDDMPLKMPRLRTNDAWMALGFHESLDEAAFIALNNMLDLIMAQFSCTREEALALASTTVDLRVTQIVNGVKGIHAVLRDGAIR